MKQLLKTAVLSTFCLAISACGPKEIIRLVPIAIPAERMDCQPVLKANRPLLPKTYTIDWSKVLTVPQAKSENEKLLGSVLAREMVVTDYILDLEGKVFSCANDAEWLRDYSRQVEK
jgi:hypothetical protein